MKLSQNFSLEEMTASAIARQRGIPNVPNAEQIANLSLLCRKILQPIRDKVNIPVNVTSGFRCEALNKIVGGAKTSRHLRGEAADIIAKDNKQLWEIIIGMIRDGEIKVGQLIDEKNLSWIHISLPYENKENQIFQKLR